MWPLSFSQQRMWFLDRLQNGNSVAYNVPLATHIRGPLDVSALEQALTMLAARHAILRTTIIEHDGEPRSGSSRPAPSISKSKRSRTATFRTDWTRSCDGRSI